MQTGFKRTPGAVDDARAAKQNKEKKKKGEVDDIVAVVMYIRTLFI